jgi:Uma2 family endonuclease
MVALPKLPAHMTVADFLAWSPPDGRLWQLVDGTPQAMAPASRTHAYLQGEVAGIIRDHLRARRSPCVLAITPGVVPRIGARDNVRVPDLAVTCSPYAGEEGVVSEPVLIVELLSPSNKAETRANVRAYTTIPSVQEILVLETEAIAADLLRRDADRGWPAEAIRITSGDLHLASIDLILPLAACYATTRLAQRQM